MRYGFSGLLPICAALSMVGMTNLLADVSTEKLTDLSLDELLNIPVTSYSRYAQESKRVPASVDVITAAEIATMGYQSIDEVLSSVIGIYKTDSHAWFGSLNYGVRGNYSVGYFSEMVLLIDGMDQKSLGASGIPLERIGVPIESIKRIEVIRGPMSVTYGNMAFLGAINIITFDEIEPKNEKVSVTASQHSHRVTWTINDHSDAFSYKATVSLKNKNGPSVPFSDLMSDTSILSAIGLSPQDELATHHRSNFFQLVFTTPTTKFLLKHLNAKNSVVDAIPGVGNGSIAENTSNAGRIERRFDINKSWHSTLQLDFLDYAYHLDEEFLFADYYSNNHSKNRTQRLNLDFVYSPSSDLKVINGISWARGDYFAIDDYPQDGLINWEYDLDEDYSLSYFGIYSNVFYNINNDWEFTGGIRLERNGYYDLVLNYDRTVDDPNNQEIIPVDNTDLVVLPRFSMTHYIDQKNLIKFIYGSGSKEASVGENLNTSNSLESERIRSVELIYEHSSTNFYFRSSIFRNELYDLISGRFDFVNNTWLIDFDNIGKITTNGVELGIRYQPNQDFLIQADFAYYDAQNKTPFYKDIALGFSPDYMLKIKSSFKTSDFSSLGLYIESMDSTESQWIPDTTQATPTEQVALGSRYGLKAKSYTLVNLNWRLTFQEESALSMNLAVKNLFNETIYNPTSINRIFDKGIVKEQQELFIGAEYNFQ